MSVSAAFARRPALAPEVSPAWRGRRGWLERQGDVAALHAELARDAEEEPALLGRVVEGDRDWAWVHDSPERAVAWRARRADSLVVPAAFAVRPTVVRIEPDARLRWDGVPWRVLNRGLDKITFQCEGGTDRVAVLSLADVETLLKRGALLPDGGRSQRRAGRRHDACDRRSTNDGRRSEGVIWTRPT